MFKTASRLKLRFLITLSILGDYANKLGTGQLSVESLWDLPIQVLDRLAVSLEEEYKSSGQKSFIVKKTQKDKEIKLRFDIVRDILDTLVEEQDAKRVAQQNREYNSEIDSLIAKKQHKELSKMSIKDLEELKKK